MGNTKNLFSGYFFFKKDLEKKFQLRSFILKTPINRMQYLHIINYIFQIKV